MRFHIGFSKKISWKWLLLIGGALLAFFGIGNHAVLALQVEADASGIYARFPQNAGDGYTAGEILNFSSNSPYNVSWSGNRYSAFNIESNPTRLGDGTNLFPNGRIRWTYASGTFNKCTSEQSATITFEFYLRKFTSTYMPKNWETPNLFSKVWVNTSSVGYDCQIASRNGIKMTVSCTSKNPTSTYYIALENFNAPWPNGLISDSQINIGVRPLEVVCTGMDSGAIISNNNNNTTNIINNNNNNTQEIINSNEANTQEIIDSITVPQPFTNEDLPSFSIDNMLITSQTQKLFMLPIQLLNYVIQGLDTPNVCQPLTVNLSSLNTLLHSNVGSISIPCMGTRIKNYIGENWYNTFDYLMGAIVFYYIASNIVLRIQQIFSGVDTLPSYYSSHGKTKTLIVNNDTGEVIG